MPPKRIDLKIPGYPCSLQDFVEFVHWDNTSTMATGGKKLNLLSLDGGGIRGLSTLYVLKQVMKSINPKCPPKPCEYFDMIAGTSTGG